jgi:hypothetical protein
MRKNKKVIVSVSYLTYLLIFSVIVLSFSVSNAKLGNAYELKSNNGGPRYSNATLISDGYNGVYWNNGSSGYPSIATDNQGGVHVVWRDDTNGTWGTDSEIMYSKYTKTTGWTYPLVISDGFDGSYWNDGESYYPTIATDDNGNIHVAWADYTDGPWGTDNEIMYVKFTPKVGWSNVSIVSDGFGGSYWNDGTSSEPSIGVNSEGTVHIVWWDTTDGIWGDDSEIMHAKNTPGAGWSNITLVSDNGIFWNDDTSTDPSIAVESQGTVHVAWEDYTEGPWGGGSRDREIMYAKLTPGSGWTNVTVITGGAASSSDESSTKSTIATDDQGRVYLAWSEFGGDLFGYDAEILFSKFTPGSGWSNASVISDGFGGNYWNDGQSDRPSIDVDDQGNAYLIWDDGSDGPWRFTGGDYEIMYSVYTESTGEWTYPIVISDGFDGSYWNHGNSWLADVAVDNQDGVHVVWWDYSAGPWETDSGDQEIMYVFVEKSGALDKTQPSAFTVSTNADTPDDDGIFVLKWTKSENAEEYSILLEKNATLEEYASGLKDRTFTVLGLSNGSYTFKVEASNEYGTILSNEINITVEIPALSQDLKDGNETLEEDGTPSIPFGNFYLSFLVIGVLSVSIIVYYKQKKE